MAYGVNAPWGLKPWQYLNGTPYLGATREYPLASGYVTSLFTGDPVMPLADGTIGIGTAGNPCLGVFMGVKYTATDGSFQMRPMWTGATTVLTGTVPVALIADDPNLVFNMQEAATNTAVGTGTAGTPLTLADRNFNINFKAPTTGVVATGQSAYFIDNASEADTSTLNLKILGLTPVPGNVVGNYANWLVTWNVHVLKSVGTTGV